MKKHTLISLMTLSLFTAISTGCGNGSSSAVSYDGRVYDISESQNGTLNATSTKVGYNYALSISGTGNGIDYSSAKSVPWYPITKKIESVTIESGIEYVGDYYFYSVSLDSIFLPETVVAVGEHTFSPDTVVYTYGGNLTNIDNEVYVYSASRPTKSGKYFYVDDDGNPVVWPKVLDNPSFLFIGNSFTYKQGTTENPAVPNYFHNIAASLGQNTTIDFVVEGSYTLSSYADATDKLGAVVDEKIRTNKYDYVILQEQSTRPINNPDLFESAVASLKGKIDKYQSDCQTILYETWGTPYNAPSYGGTVAAMEATIREEYTKCAKANKCSVDYVGKAFTEAYESQEFSDAGIDIYNADDHRHQSEYGAYLSAAVHVRSIFQLDVSGCTDYCGLDETKCKTVLRFTDKNI